MNDADSRLVNTVSVYQGFCPECSKKLSKEDVLNNDKMCIKGNEIQYVCLDCQEEL